MFHPKFTFNDLSLFEIYSNYIMTNHPNLILDLLFSSSVLVKKLIVLLDMSESFRLNNFLHD